VGLVKTDVETEKRYILLLSYIFLYLIFFPVFVIGFLPIPQHFKNELKHQ
jgi:hypothetical protein